MVDKFHKTAEFLPTWDSEEIHASQAINPPATAPMLLLMAGFAGTGKTTLARWLFEKLRKSNSEWEILIKDNFKRAHLAQKEDVESAGWHAFKDMFALLEREVLAKRKSCIIDTSNERTFVFDTIQTALKQPEHCHTQPYQVKVLLCIADREIRTRRLEQRGSEFKPFVQELPKVLADSSFEDCFKHLLDTPPLPEKFSHAPGELSVEYISKGLVINTTPVLETYGKLVLQKLELIPKQQADITPDR